MAMEWEDLGDWVTWGVLALLFLATLLTALIFLAFILCHAFGILQDCCFRRGRRSAAGKTPLSIDELLESIPDVAYSGYNELPPAADADDKYSRERDWCAICVAPYESGEACTVLPGCTHTFHKPCVGSWLRKNNTCPLCRATVTVVPAAAARHPSSRRQQGNNAAEDRV
ncbi:unnamed protein product [Urochloa humidicola]